MVTIVMFPTKKTKRRDIEFIIYILGCSRITAIITKRVFVPKWIVYCHFLPIPMCSGLSNLQLLSRKI